MPEKFSAPYWKCMSRLCLDAFIPSFHAGHAGFITESLNDEGLTLIMWVLMCFICPSAEDDIRKGEKCAIRLI